VDPYEHYVRLRRAELEAEATAQRRARACARAARPSLLLRVYARLWWASRPRAAAWTPGLFDTPVRT
jgi:hypothetical protein